MFLCSGDVTTPCHGAAFQGGPVVQCPKARQGGAAPPSWIVALRAALAAGALFILLRTDEKLRHREAAIQPGTRSLEAKPELDTCSGSCLCPREFPSRFPLSGRLVNYSARARIHAAHVHMHTPSLALAHSSYTHSHPCTHMYTLMLTHSLTLMLTPPCTHKCTPSSACRRKAIRWRRKDSMWCLHSEVKVCSHWPSRGPRLPGTQFSHFFATALASEGGVCG